MDSVEILMPVSASDWHGWPMTAIGGAGPQPGGITWAGETAVTTCVIVALVPVGVLHVSSIGAVDPLTDTVSDYAYQPGGYALLGTAVLALAAAAVVVAGGLRRAGLPRPGAPTGLLLSAGAALALAAVFPTNQPGSAAGVVAFVHRAAGGWAYVTVPLAAWMVARRARTAPGWIAAAPALIWCSGGTGVVSAGYLLSHVPIVITGSPGFALLGGFQRVLCAGVMVVLVTSARAARFAMEAAPSTAAVLAGPGLRSAT